MSTERDLRADVVRSEVSTRPQCEKVLSLFAILCDEVRGGLEFVGGLIPSAYPEMLKLSL